MTFKTTAATITATAGITIIMVITTITARCQKLDHFPGGVWAGLRCW